MKRKKGKELRNALKNFVILLLLATAFSTASFIVMKRALENRDKNETVEKGEESSEKLDKTQLAIKINSMVTLKSAYKKGEFGIENKSNNVYDIVVKLYIKETNELIYTSPKLNPGDKIKEASLDKKLNEGTYTCIAYFEAYDENNNYRGKSGAEIKLKVQG